MNVLIVGASRGLGLEWVRQYRAAGASVTATARRAEALDVLRGLGASPFPLDVADAESASQLSAHIEGMHFDVVVVCAGVSGPHSTGLAVPTDAEFDEVMHTNVLGPMRVVAQVAGALAPGAKLAVISSMMGAIGPRGDTAMWLYRASKAAVNSVLKDASLVLGKKAICVSLHPGWVRTEMGGPNADLSPEESVSGMRSVLAGLTSADNGRFINHDGADIAW